MPINEPAEGRKKSQIEEYLDFYGTPGVQHIALRTDDIVAAVRALRAAGVRFMEVPADLLRRGARADGRHRPALGRPRGARRSWSTATTAATCCRSSPRRVTDRPTVFFEIIQREGATGFGEGNFKALFEAIEREQARRGNL